MTQRSGIEISIFGNRDVTARATAIITRDRTATSFHAASALTNPSENPRPPKSVAITMTWNDSPQVRAGKAMRLRNGLRIVASRLRDRGYATQIRERPLKRAANQ